MASHRVCAIRACLLVSCVTAVVGLASVLHAGFGPRSTGAATGTTVQVLSNASPLELAAESYCHFTPARVAKYCAVSTMDKTLVAPGDCSTYWYAEGALDSDRTALDRCKKAGRSGCHIEDRQGDICFAWSVPDWAQPHFRNYCAARTPKNFFMRSDATRVYWLHEDRVSNEQCPGCYLYDHNGGRCPCKKAPGDMRCQLQACVQYEPYWCWATSVSIVAGYYFPQKFPNGGSDGPNCRGLECKIVGELHYPKTPDICCKNKDHCSNSHANSGADIVNALNLYTKIPWTRVNAPVNVLLVKNVLMDGHPIVWDVKLPGSAGAGNGHAMIMGGTDGNGLFYVHDSMNTKGKGSFQMLTWAEIMWYKLPWADGVAELWGVYVPSHYVN